MAARSKAWVCDHSPAGIAGSIPAGGHGCLSVECCVLLGRGLCDGLITRPEESYGCLSVVSVVCCQVEVCCECCVLSGRGLL